MTSVPADWAAARPGIKHWFPDARGDDPVQRVVHAPTGTGPGDGKSFLFLFGYRTASEQDRSMSAAELAHIDDDIATLCDPGYTVVVDRQATRRDLLEAVAAEGTAGFYWSSHGGEDGRLQCCDGDEVLPGDLDPTVASPDLRLAVLGACYVGAHAAVWRAALGGRPLVAGWGRPVTLDRAVDRPCSLPNGCSRERPVTAASPWSPATTGTPRSSRSRSPRWKARQRDIWPRTAIRSRTRRTLWS